MKTNHRFTIILVSMLMLLLLANLLNMLYNFRTSSQQASVDKAASIASVVKSGLLAHSVNGIMDKRQYFLNRLAKKNGIDGLWIARSEALNRQFGKGFPAEASRDEVDRAVLTTGKVSHTTLRQQNKTFLRISFPYIASASETSPSCFSCHHVKPGTVLGTVSMRMDIGNMKEVERSTLLKIFWINLIFIVLGILITNYFFKPYVRFFESLKHGIKEAYRGNFSHRFPATLKGDGGELTTHLNDLYGKMDETFGHIKHDLGTFLTQSALTRDDPLQEAQIIIRELSDLYKFKHTIEFDKTKEEVYGRLIQVLQKKFHVDSFTLQEIDKSLHVRYMIHTTLSDGDHCTLPEEAVQDCRAFRTGAVVNSSEFEEVCPYCRNSDVRYLCIPIAINDQISLILTLYPNDEEQQDTLHHQITSIRNYFETAKPVIESRLLTSQLRESSLRDGMTSLYNRRFLEEFIDNLGMKISREAQNYHMLMLDIDYFKLINDTYGHDAGDMIIQRLADVMREGVRASDLVIRYGGEEFLLMLRNVHDEEAQQVAEKIRVAFEQEEFKLDGDLVRKTVSIGIASFPNDSHAIWKVIKYADIALYEAKRSGRNKTVRFTPEMFQYEEI
jgi:diguanylate cyclase (GGDEF)-like protein